MIIYTGMFHGILPNVTGKIMLTDYLWMYINGWIVVVVVVVVFTLKTVMTSFQYPSLSYSSRQRNEFPWSQANPK